MKKLYKELIKQIYYGECYPDQEIMPKDSDYHIAYQKIDEGMKYFDNICSSDDRKIFNELRTAFYDVRRMDTYANFEYGFRMEILLMNEVYSSDNDSIFDELRNIHNK